MNDFDGPDLIPARMVNEFVYCPRLCYLEWVQQRWDANEDTVQGTFRHRSVDSKGGVMPEPTNRGKPRSTYSVAVADENLGLTAVIDRVDHTETGAVPVDIKKGHPQRDGTPWPADRMQVLAHAALLESQGFPVAAGKLFYDAAQAQVSVPWDAEAKAHLRQTVTEMRQVMAATEAPLPLLDDPRCPRCSLSGLCLPDELNSLLHRSVAEPRRILPRNPDAAPLYVVEQGAKVGVKGGRINVIVKGEVRADLRLIDVLHLCVLGHVQVTTEALTRLWANGSTVIWLSTGGWLNGWSQSHPGKYVDLRRRQVATCAQGGPIASAIVAGKIRNQRTLLRRNAKRPFPEGTLEALRDLANLADTCTEVSSLLGYEGTAARLYFSRFGTMLTDPAQEASFQEAGRTRRPPTDPVNAALGFAYSLLLKDLTVACLAVGMDPYLGVLHRPRYGRPALALDLAEEFRALVADSVVIQAFNNREITSSSFICRNSGVQLTADGRRSLIAAYERRMQQEVIHPVFKYRISYRRCIDVQARLMAATFVGEIPRYAPMTTR